MALAAPGMRSAYTAAMQWTAASSLDYFALLVAEDQRFPLLEAAASIGQDEYPELDLQNLLAEVDTLSVRLAARLPADAGMLHKVRLLHRFFFEELGFSGNLNDYYSADNSYLHRVLLTRQGIPITLGVLYAEFAHRIGLDASGVSFPGHFLVKLRLPQGDALIDPMTGQSLSRESLEERLEPYLAQVLGIEGRPGLGMDLLPNFLASAPPREIVARMLRNLEAIHRQADDWPRLLAVQQRLVVLQPQDWDWRRDRGLTYAELGQVREAIDDLAAYLRHAGTVADRADISEKLAELRAGGVPRWH
jgi:regulator of sirC expression with transglutaminase-like and TPR domain